MPLRMVHGHHRPIAAEADDMTLGAGARPEVGHRHGAGADLERVIDVEGVHENVRAHRERSRRSPS